MCWFPYFVLFVCSQDGASADMVPVVARPTNGLKYSLIKRIEACPEQIVALRLLDNVPRRYK
jgi:hypothetical protein